MGNHALPLSILALAAAIAFHAVEPAVADVPPEPPPPIDPPTATPEPIAPECRPIRLGTPKEYEKVMGELHASGRTQMTVVGSGLVCAWR